MVTYRPLKIALCIYDGMRLIFLMGVFIVLQPGQGSVFPWLAVISPGALFFLMALFLLMDISQYRMYCPLYLAGKGFSVAATIFWIVSINSETISELLLNNVALAIVPGIVFFMVLGDLLSALLIIKLTKEIPD